MSTKSTLALSAIAAAALAFVIGPVLVQTASAVPAEETVVTTECSDEQFARHDGCPGKSEDSSGIGATGDREEETTCTARNPGQAKD